ncbi:hypothetical protein HMPREF0083_03028 [Aneurinibacillus aneurinilyticus ATCC 12856]|uniref:Uncharacterized protein n=1 Tax=Aneurinibacillus aneurinilyticus ATCC 12856 TaxID=649747 RepID=U1X2V8_ANEAE|nr:hypothetical protein HMPREF0083_03028 [Aneurinibacillus aneurinilyticus ATCC 12856]
MFSRSSNIEQIFSKSFLACLSWKDFFIVIYAVRTRPLYFPL